MSSKKPSSSSRSGSKGSSSTRKRNVPSSSSSNKRAATTTAATSSSHVPSDLFGVNVSSMFMWMTCAASFSFALIAELQLKRHFVWSLTVWIGLTITQAALATIGFLLLIKRTHDSKKRNLMNNPSMHTLHLAFVTVYLLLAWQTVADFLYLYTEADGHYRVNVLETKARATTPVTQFELDIRDALWHQVNAGIMACASFVSVVLAQFMAHLHRPINAMIGSVMELTSIVTKKVATDSTDESSTSLTSSSSEGSESEESESDDDDRRANH